MSDVQSRSNDVKPIVKSKRPTTIKKKLFNSSVGFMDDVNDKSKNIKPQTNSTKITETQVVKANKPVIKSRSETLKSINIPIDKKSSESNNVTSNVKNMIKPKIIKPNPVVSDDDDADIIMSDDELSTDEEPTEDDLDFIDDDDDESDAERVQEFLNRFKAAYRPNRVTDL